VLIIAIAIAGLVYGRAATEGNIVRSISGVVGSGAAQFTQELVQSASRPGAGVIAVVVGAGGLVLGSAGFFLPAQRCAQHGVGSRSETGLSFRGYDSGQCLVLRHGTRIRGSYAGIAAAYGWLERGRLASGQLRTGRRDGLAGGRLGPDVWPGHPAVCLHFQDLTGCPHPLG
jgi:hypothetical protein